MVGNVGGCNLGSCATANPPRVTRHSVVISGEFAQPLQQTVSKASCLSHRANTSKQLAINSQHTRPQSVCHSLKSSGQPLVLGTGPTGNATGPRRNPTPASTEADPPHALPYCRTCRNIGGLGVPAHGRQIARDSAAQGQMARGRR